VTDPDPLLAVLSWRRALLRTEIDALLADWAWHLDHGDYDAVAELFSEDALFITGAVELRGRAAIKNRYTERVVARSTRHTYSGLRVSAVGDDAEPGTTHGGGEGGAGGEDAEPGTAHGGGADGADGSGRTDGADGGWPARVRARSTWVSYAVNAPVPVDSAPADDVGVYLVADFDDVLTLCDGERWRISERRITGVFRDPARAPVTG
jgi:ketosteroid isomerase-like protein